MSTIVQSFRRGAWTAHIVDCDGSYGTVQRIRLDHPNGYNTDWPIKYDNGQIAYDHHNMPRDGQRAARAAFKALEVCDDSEDEPTGGDFTITPCGSLGGRSALGRVEGKFVGEFGCDGDAFEAAKQIMEDEQFWPNVWSVSDHGNWSLYVD
jgi:hypothetical protein